MSVRDGRPSARGHASESGVVRRRTSPRSVPFADFPFFIELKNGRMPFPSYAFGRERPFGESAGFPAGLFSRSLPCLGAGGNPIDLETLNGTSRRRDFPGLPPPMPFSSGRRRNVPETDPAAKILRFGLFASGLGQNLILRQTTACLAGFPDARAFDRTTNTGENIR